MKKFSAEKKLSQVLERGLESCEGWWKTFRAFAITLKKLFTFMVFAFA